MGPDAFLAPEHKVVLTTDAEQARAVGRKALEIYLNLPNYMNNWKRLGFTDDDIAKPGSDALVDAFVAYGTVDAIAARLKEHLDGRCRPRARPGARPDLTSWCPHLPNWPDRSACTLT